MVGGSSGNVCVAISEVENVISVPGSIDVVGIGDAGVATVVTIEDCSVGVSDGGFVLKIVVGSEGGCDGGSEGISEGGCEGGSEVGCEGGSEVGTEVTSRVEPVGESVDSVGIPNKNTQRNN